MTPRVCSGCATQIKDLRRAHPCRRETLETCCSYKQAVEARSLPLVELLEREYAVSLARDPQLPALLQAAKGAHFALPQQGMGGVLGSLFSMLSAEEGQPA